MFYTVRVQSATVDARTAALDYCRRARRIRASFSRDPFLRHRALSDLNIARDAETQAIKNPVRVQTALRRIPPAMNRQSAVSLEAQFAEQATEQLQPFGFTFTDRIDLLDGAERLGIPRFRANMILALQEHRPKVNRPVKAGAITEPFAPSLVMILTIEAIAVAGLFWLCTML